MKLFLLQLSYHKKYHSEIIECVVIVETEYEARILASHDVNAKSEDWLDKTRSTCRYIKLVRENKGILTSEMSR